eukprot:3472762-Alexandrium_andersonii.AAC.1
MPSSVVLRAGGSFILATPALEASLAGSLRSAVLRRLCGSSAFCFVHAPTRATLPANRSVAFLAGARG